MSDSFVQGVLSSLDYSDAAEGRPVLSEDPGIMTTMDIIEGLKRGSVPGTAIVRWKDSHGTIEANVIDFIMQESIDAQDASTGEKVSVDSKLVPDGTWQLFS